MYQLVQFIRHKVPFLWNLIESVNSQSFGLRYSSHLKKLPELFPISNSEEISYHLAQKKDVEDLAAFFKAQPEEAYEFFKPHMFDEATLLKLVKNPAFIMIIARHDNKIVGYAFLRCFANGKSFRGKIVDINYRGRGIAKSFGLITTDVASMLGIGLYGTISKANLSSMASSKSSNEIKILEELPDNFLLIQYLPKH